MLFEQKDTVVFIGDSISDYDRKKPVGEGLFNAWGTSYVACASALLACMYPELHLRLVNMGISGNQTRDLVRRWQTDVLDRNPDWVVTLIGINDVWRQFDSPAQTEEHVSPEEYRRNLIWMINKTKDRVKGLIFISPYFMEPNKGDAMRARMDEYGAIVRDLCEAYHLTFVDAQAAWDRLFVHMHPCNIAWDRIHPNQTGCMYLAKTFLSAIGFDR